MKVGEKRRNGSVFPRTEAGKKVSEGRCLLEERVGLSFFPSEEGEALGDQVFVQMPDDVDDVVLFVIAATFPAPSALLPQGYSDSTHHSLVWLKHASVLLPFLFFLPSLVLLFVLSLKGCLLSLLSERDPLFVGLELVIVRVF